MKIVGVEFVRSASAAADFPCDPLPQVALVGRSNVGKSTLINALTKSRVARTSAAPGKTRLINLYRVELAGSPARLYLADLPGYGYARGGQAARAGFDALVAEYFMHPAPGAIQAGAAGSGGRQASRTPGPPHGPAFRVAHGPSAALLVVDARHPGLSADVAALTWLVGQGRPVVAIASKIDKLSRAERQRAEQQWAHALNVPVLPVSAVTGEGLKELWTQISRLVLNGPSAPSAPNTSRASA